METIEQRFVRRSQMGDPAAFEELVRLTARGVYARVALDCRDRAMAEDLVQEVYLRAWRSIASVEDATKIRPWLMKIAQTVVVDWARRSGRKKRKGDLANGPRAVGEEDLSPADQVERQEEVDLALAAMRGLPERYRQVMSLRYLADADAQAIQQEMNITSGALRGLLHRGIELMRKKLGTGFEKHQDRPVRYETARVAGPPGKSVVEKMQC